MAKFGDSEVWLPHAIKSVCSFAGIDVPGTTFYLSDKDEDEHEPEQPQEEPAVMETHSLMRSASHSKTAHISRLLLEEPRHSQMPLVSRLRLEGSSAVSYSKMPLISRLLLEGPSTVIHP